MGHKTHLNERKKCSTYFAVVSEYKKWNRISICPKYDFYMYNSWFYLVKRLMPFVGINNNLKSISIFYGKNVFFSCTKYILSSQQGIYHFSSIFSQKMYIRASLKHFHPIFKIQRSVFESQTLLKRITHVNYYRYILFVRLLPITK